MARIVAIASAAAVAVGLVVGALMVWFAPGDDPFAECRRSQVAGGAADIGGPFALIDGSGAEVTSEEVITGPTLIYFGYTFCPDICPTDVARNAAAADMLAERGIDVGQVFISVDPARDTPEVVGDFAAAIHPGLVGLTGTEQAVAEAAGAYRVYASRAAGGDEDYYLVDHSTFTYLAAPGSPFLDFYRSDAGAGEIADSVACYAERL